MAVQASAGAWAPRYGSCDVRWR
jgi:hypothetical protein